MRVLFLCLFACAALMAFACDAQAAVGFQVDPNFGNVNQTKTYDLKLTGLTPGKLYKVTIQVPGQTDIDDEFTADANGEIDIPPQDWTWGSIGCRVLDADIEAKDGTETQVQVTASINVNS